MQSTVSNLVSAPSNVEYLDELLSRNAVSESFQSQAETSNRMPILSGISLAQQERRMRHRPFSLTAIEVADSNRFEVCSDSLAITCNHPSIFAALNSQANSQMRQTLTEILVETKPTALINSAELPALELGFDFAQREWPAYEADPMPAARTSCEALSDWSMENRLTRTAAARKRVQSIADPDCLRELLDDARIREAQRITAKMRAVSGSRYQSETVAKVMDSISELMAKARLRLQVLHTYLAHTNNRENYGSGEQF